MLLLALMDTKLNEFAKTKGHAAAKAAVEKYRAKRPEFDENWATPMMFASGFTAGRLTRSISDEWIKPLKRQIRIAGTSALIALAFLIGGMFYAWSIVSLDSFVTFLAAFAPAVAALIFSVTKSYKTWAEARKHIAEAKAIEKAVQSEMD
ncbi:hypothetical protein [uncultured Desulfobulbus sp.]|uniref:hypothetical protein n=1 Tax=uncultured Desulfobulbus sp. TaxID=239745 RepID=UPI0029C96505|nr:hypothetical protein [uncultured Desulfobulbus sp.]